MVPASPDSAAEAEQKLCILFISRALPVHRLGGLEYHLRDLAAGLSARGHEVHILTTEGGKEESSIPGAKIYELEHSKAGDYSLQFFRYAGHTARLLAAELKPDVICPIDMAGLFINPADFPAPVVPIIHGTMTSEVPLDWRFSKNLSWVGRLRAAWRYKPRIALNSYFGRMINRMDYLVVDSEFTRRELALEQFNRRNFAWEAGERSAALARKIIVVPLGIDFSRYPEPESQLRPSRKAGDKLRICMLGRLQEQKGIAIAIRAAAALRTRGVDFLLSIGGTGEFMEPAAAMIENFGLNSHVSLLGRVPPGELAKFFASHDVFLFPDLTQPAFGLVAVEALHYGLPVVASRVGAVPEVVSDTCGWLYDPWNVSELAGLLMKLYDDPGELDRKAGCTRERADVFSVEKMIQKTESVFLLASAVKTG